MNFTLSSVPTVELERLKKRERAQASETKGRGLPVEFVSIEGLLLLQQGLCGKTKKPLVFSEDDPDRKNGKPVIAHVIDRTVKRCPGHVVGNVELWRHDANQEMAAIEQRDRGVARRMAVDLTRKTEAKAEKPKSRLQSRNTLSKECRQAVKERMKR